MPLGDVDGDGRTDLMAIVAPNGDSSSFLLSGRRWRRELDARSERLWIRRPKGSFEFSPAGDANGDGLADVVVRRHNFACKTAFCRTGLLFARAGTFTTALETPGGDGTEIVGADTRRRK